jgi:hypothetical protein
MLCLVGAAFLQTSGDPLDEESESEPRPSDAE